MLDIVSFNIVVGVVFLPTTQLLHLQHQKFTVVSRMSSNLLLQLPGFTFHS